MVAGLMVGGVLSILGGEIDWKGLSGEMLS